MAEHTTQVAFRFSDELVERLDRFVESRARELRGVRFSRADAVRQLLEEGLERAGFPPPIAPRRKR